MAAMLASAQNRNGFVFASSDAEFELHLRQAAEATQLEETLELSTLTFAYDLQLAEISVSTPVSNPSSSKDETSSSKDEASSSKDEASSSHSKDEKEPMTAIDYEEDCGFEFQDYGGEKRRNSKGKEVMDTGPESREGQVQRVLPFEQCRICCEDSTEEMFEGLRCLHRFCHPCMTKFIHTMLEQKRHQIHCPHESCGEPIRLRECRYFLPVEIIDAWSALILEAEIPESQKVYCPFPDCSAMLVREDVVSPSAQKILNAECAFCNRMFCVRCMVPWHADLDCKEFLL